MKNSITPADECAAKIDQIMQCVKEVKLNYYQKTAADELINAELEIIREPLDKYPTPLIHDLHHEITHERTRLAVSLINLISGGNQSAADVHEYFIFRPHMNPDLGHIIVSSFISALHQYPQLPAMENYAEAPAEVQEKVIALLKVTEAVASHPSTNRKSLTDVREGVLLSGDNLIQLVLDRPEDADHIARIITERHTTDTAFITTILDSSAPALSHGII